MVVVEGSNGGGGGGIDCYNCQELIYGVDNVNGECSDYGDVLYIVLLMIGHIM